MVLLISIFSGLGLFNLIAAIIVLLGGASAFGVITFGLGFLLSSTASEAMFRSKLSELDEKLSCNIRNVQSQKYERIQKLDEYFNNFEQRLHHCHIHGHNSKINIVWYDKNLQNHENQCYIERLRNEFSPEQYQIMQFDDKDQSIDSVVSNITNNLVLITSGSAGEEIISEIGYYFHIKGIIIFGTAVEYHQTWARKYKKVLLITNMFSQVIQEIKDIENGQIYFVNYGFSFDDITIKLKNIEYYLSTSQNGFIIPNFSAINSSIDYHNMTMTKLHNELQKKHVYPKDIPSHFQLDNLLKCAQQFVEALKKPEPEKHIIHLYTTKAPYYYKIINDILNLLDEDLILIIQDYIKALRYSLIIYKDVSNKILPINNVKLYRGISLAQDNSFAEFSRKFKIHDTIIFPAFSSTSVNKDRTRSFIKGKGVLLKISADCSKLNRPKSISAQSQYPNEDEVLLNCFSILKVEGITTMNDDLLCYKCILELR
ncbi:unnamed protein product [Rotaria sordida]|uniref:ADP ribosyltransferase domain-containing protein n=1 Tax=Rotaria sordida TaxID=392033 RepID=A0A819XZV6_9BILA|nr:unnamed protein product [Rotaria sordida]